MKVCSHCEFLYEDEQERCEMDGAELVYEPTLDRVFPHSQTLAQPQEPRSLPARLVIPIEGTAQPARRGRLVLQIAAVLLLALVAFVGFYSGPRFLSAKTASASEGQPKNSSLLSPVVLDKSPTTAPAADLSNLGTVPVADKQETRNLKTESLTEPHKVEARNTIAPLPGVKPLPRLKPLPTLKPLPRLTDQNRDAKTRKSNVVNVETKKESRFGALLKKTGRILSKPFGHK